MDAWKSMVYWWERREDAHAITRHVERLLNSLAAIDPVLSTWQSPPRLSSKSREMIPFESGYFERVELEQDGRSRRDDNGAVIEENGFHASLLTCCPPGTDDYTAITLRAGAYGDGQTSPNSCIIRVGDSPYYDCLRTLENQCAIIRALAEAWTPDYGFASSPLLLNERYEQWRAKPQRTPVVGWLTYLPVKRGPIPALAPPARTLSLGDLGSIIVASRERMSVAQPETIAAVDVVEVQLAQAGLLEPEPFRPEVILS